PITEEQEAVAVEAADIADRREVAAPARGRFGRGASVLEAIAGVRFDVDRAFAARRKLAAFVVENPDRGPGNRSADRSGALEPFLGRNDRALSFGGAVRFPDDRPPPVEHRALRFDRARRAAVHDEAE